MQKCMSFAPTTAYREGFGLQCGSNSVSFGAGDMLLQQMERQAADDCNQKVKFRPLPKARRRHPAIGHEGAILVGA
jgi:hypothetical protein